MATPEALLVRAYGDLTTRLNSLIQEAEAAGRTTAYLEGQLFEVRTALARVEGAETEFAARQVAKEYRTSAADAQFTIKAEGARLYSTGFTGFDRRAVRALQTRVSGRLTGFRRALTEGLALGDPRLAIPGILKTLEGKSNLTKVVGGQLKVITPKGQFWDPKAYARMLSRTAVADTRRVAFRQRYAQNGIDVVKVVANGTTHAVCAAWEGVSLSLTGETPGLPTVADARGAGLFHPNCRHRYVMDRDAKQETPDKLLAVKPPEAARPILGKPPPKVSGVVKAAAKKAALKAPKAAMVAAKALPKPKVPKPAVKILELEEIKIIELPPVKPKVIPKPKKPPKLIQKPELQPTIKPVAKPKPALVVAKKPVVKKPKAKAKPKPKAAPGEIDELLKYEITGEMTTVHEQQLVRWMRELTDEASPAGLKFGAAARQKLKADFEIYKGKVLRARKIKNKTSRRLALRQHNERFSKKMHLHAQKTGLLGPKPVQTFAPIPRAGPLPRASVSMNPRKGFDQFENAPDPEFVLKRRTTVRDRKDLTRGQREGVGIYTGDGYRRINNQLRKPRARKDATTSRVIRDIDQAIDRSEAGMDLVAYRGTGGTNPGRMGNYEVGFEFGDTGFGSFSADRKLAVNFLHSTEGLQKQGVLIRMRLNKADKALWINTYEHEFLLPRGTRYRIVDVEELQIGTRTDIKRKVVTVEMIPPRRTPRRRAA